MTLLVLSSLAWLAWLLTLPPRPSAWIVAASGVPLLLLASRAAYRGHPGSWHRFLTTTWDIHALGAVLLLALGVQFEDAHGITTDGVIYFSQLRSVIFDRDLDVAAEFVYLRQPPRPSHVVPIGPTLVWLPLYAAVAVVEWIGTALGWVSAATVNETGRGLTPPYVRAALVSSFAIGAVGLGVLHGYLRRTFSPAVALPASLLLFAATPLVWYMVYEPAMTHAASFGLVAIFVVASARLTSVSMRVPQSMLLGALLGVAVMTRPQEAVFALFPATLLLLARASLHVRLRAAVNLAAWAFAGILPFLAIQALHTTVLLRRERFALVGGGGYLDFLDSRWSETLWSSWHGFFSWTPITYVAFVAMFVYVIRDRRWSVAAILIVLVMAWVNGSTADWAAGWSFGGRRFTSVLTVLAPGVAFVVHGLMQRPMVALSIVAACGIGWNQLLVTQHREGMLRPDARVSFAQVIRQQADIVTRPPFFYPFAFPANVVFAWRTGLPIEAYDLLGAERLRDAIDVQMTPEMVRYLTTGWAGRVSDPFGDLRWIEGDRAEMLLPLDVPSDRPVTVSWSARTRRLDPPEPVTFALVVNDRETFRFTPETDQSSFFQFTVPAGSGMWVRGFNRIAFERRAGRAPLGIYTLAIK